MAHRIGGALAIVAFSLVCLIGLVEQQPLDRALPRAVGAMLAFYVVGRGLGAIAARLLREHFHAEIADMDGSDMEEPGTEKPADVPASAEAPK